MKKIVIIIGVILVGISSICFSSQTYYFVAKNNLNIDGLIYQIGQSTMTDKDVVSVNRFDNDLSIKMENILSAEDESLLIQIYDDHNGEAPPFTPTAGISENNGIIYLQSSGTHPLIVNSVLEFSTSSEHSVGTELFGRPWKIWVASQIIVGENCMIINENSIFSSLIDDYVMAVSTTEIRLGKKIKVPSMEITTDGFRSHGRGKVLAEDIEIDGIDRGIILTAQNDTKWLVWVDNSGTIFTTQVAASPEISFEERQQLIATKKAEISEIKSRKNGNSTLPERIQRIEEWLGIE